MFKNKKIMLAASISLVTSLWAASSAAEALNADKALVKGNEYLVVGNYPDNLQVVDLQDDTVYKTCKMPGQFGPAQVLVSPDKSRAYVLNNGFRSIYGFDLDSCELVFEANFSQKPNEDARAMFSMAVSVDGKEIYTVNNPTEKMPDHYKVGKPRLQVYSADAGLKAKPIRTLDAPRQVYIMQAADDGSLYMAGPDIYKMDVHSGKYEVAIKGRNWDRENFSKPDVLYFWPHQQVNRDFSILYTAAKFTDEKQDMATADMRYGFFNVNLASGKTETIDFAPVTEIYFTGQRSPNNRNHMYGVLNRLTKYDIEKQELIKAQELDHTYYCLTFNQKADKIYLVGTLNDISIHDANTLEKTGSITLPGGDMAITTAQAFVR